MSIQQLEIERQILDAAFAKLDVGIADAFGDNWRVAPRDREHFVGHIHADDFAVRADDLRGDETDFAGAAAQIDNHFAFAQITRRIAATVIAFDHFLLNDLEVIQIVIDRTTKARLGRLRTCGIAFTND